jgi:ABC-type glycerol-3-phosphate transport system substrate-binding protein
MNYGSFSRRTALIVAALLFLFSAVGFAEGQKESLVWAEWWDPEWGEETIEWIVSGFEE